MLGRASSSLSGCGEQWEAESPGNMHVWVSDDLGHIAWAGKTLCKCLTLELGKFRVLIGCRQERLKPSGVPLPWNQNLDDNVDGQTPAPVEQRLSLGQEVLRRGTCVSTRAAYVHLHVGNTLMRHYAASCLPASRALLTNPRDRNSKWFSTLLSL